MPLAIIGSRFDLPAQVATLRLPILMKPFDLLFLFFLSAGVLVEKLYGIPFCKDLQKKSLVDKGQRMKGLNLEGSSYLPESLEDMQHLK